MSSGSGSGLFYLLILGLPFLLLVWMFLTQRNRQKQTQALQASLEVGDEVLTTSGMYGTITALDELSMGSPSVPVVKQLVRSVRHDDAVRLAGEALRCDTVEEVKGCVISALRDLGLMELVDAVS